MPSFLEASDFVALTVATGGLCTASILWYAGRRAAARLVWVVVIVAATVPFWELSERAHWGKVGWLPFGSPPVEVADIAANVALYVPFGFLSRPRRPSAAALARTGSEAGALSFTVEVAQLFSRSRFPSSTDIVCNMAGAVLGLALTWVVG